MRQRWLAAAGGLAVLLVLGIAALGMNVGDASVNSLSQKGAAREGVVMLEQAGIPVGVLSPIDVLITSPAASDRVVGALARVPGVRAVIAPAEAAWRRGGTQLAEALPIADGAGPAGQATATAVRQQLANERPQPLVGGPSADLVDQIHSLYGDFPWVLAGLALITFVLLARAFRSLLLPLKAIALNLLSVGAVYGVLVLVWQDGHGSRAIWGLPPTGAITAWIPLFVFAFVYGLSMDYEVFILARMREEYDATGDTNQAVITGIGRTGRLVTSAALDLVPGDGSAGERTVHVPEDLRHRGRRRHPAGRHRRALAAGPRDRLTAGQMELVAAWLGSPAAAGTAIAACRRRSRPDGNGRVPNRALTCASAR